MKIKLFREEYVMGLFGKSKLEKEKEIEAIVEGVDRGDAYAKQQLSVYFNKGLSSEEYNRIRMRVYTPKAEQGDPIAQYWLGLLYGFENQVDTSHKWYLQSAENGNIEAMRDLAFRFGEFANEPGNCPFAVFGNNPEKHIHWLQRAANLGDAKSQADIGDLFYYGDIVDKNYEEAIKWYDSASRNGSAKGYIGLAQIYNHMIDRKFFNLDKYEEVLLNAMRLGQEKEYESAASSLGMLYGATFIYDTVLDEYKKFANAKKATYCLCLAYVRGNDGLVDDIKKIGYKTADGEFERWREDAINLRFNFR